MKISKEFEDALDNLCLMAEKENIGINTVTIDSEGDMRVRGYASLKEKMDMLDAMNQDIEGEIVEALKDPQVIERLKVALEESAHENFPIAEGRA